MKYIKWHLRHSFFKQNNIRKKSNFLCIAQRRRGTDLKKMNRKYNYPETALKHFDYAEALSEIFKMTLMIEITKCRHI